MIIFSFKQAGELKSHSIKDDDNGGVCMNDCDGTIHSCVCAGWPSSLKPLLKNPGTFQLTEMRADI